MLPTDLISLGLTKTEAAVYLFIIEHGFATPAQIAKGAGILRTNCYHILQSLEAQGLIRAQARGKRRAYLACDPEALFHAIDQKRQTIARILPDLRGLYTVQKNKPKIQFYEGKDQIKEVYVSSLGAKEIHAIGSTKAMSAALPDFYRWYIAQVKTRGIIFHDLLTHASREETGPLNVATLKGLYSMKYLPAHQADIPTDMLIWNNCVAHIVLQEPIFATVITSPLIASTMRTLFQSLYERL